MSTVQEKPKFVSSIPNNKLEPVFIGRPDTDALAGSGSSTENKSGVYVPAFLKNKQEGPSVDKDVVKKPVQKKPQMTQNDFPELSSKKPKELPVATNQGSRSSYLDMLLKAKMKAATQEVVEEPKPSGPPKGYLVLGKNMNNQRGLSSWGDEEEEELDFSQPPPISMNDQYDEDEEEYAEEEDDYIEYRRR